MAIELISKIKPKNNGDFKLVDAEDIECDGKGLPDVLEEIKGSKMTEEQIQTAVNEYLKQNPISFEEGDGIRIEGNKIFVDSADKVEADNTRPVTSAAVHAICGNIETLLNKI